MATSSSTLEQTPFPASAATSSFFVLRVPVLPLEAIRHETETGSLKRALLNTADPIRSELLIKEDRARTHSRLLRVLSNTFVRDALELATPTFLNAVESSGIDFNGGPSGRRDITLNRYVTRMAARATPFGLFAGYAIGTIGDDCRLDLSNTIWRRVSRLDPKVIAQLCDLVTAERRLPSGLRVQPNSSLHRVREKWRYTARERERHRHLCGSRCR